MEEYYYCLGFLWADGHTPENTNSCSLEILSDDATQIASYFQKYFDVSIRHRKRQNRKNQSIIYIKAKQFDFHNNGYCLKSYNNNTMFDTIPKKYQRFFILGFFDGDGCWYFNKKYGLRQFYLSGSYTQDWSWIENFLNNNSIIYKINRVKNKNEYSYIRITSKNNILKIGSVLYDNHNIGLLRKRNKFFKEIVDSYLNK